jgi:hypothetical protein
MRLARVRFAALVAIVLLTGVAHAEPGDYRIVQPGQLVSAQLSPMRAGNGAGITAGGYPSASPAPVTSPRRRISPSGVVPLEGTAQAIFGIVDSLAGSTLNVVADGQPVSVDVSAIDPDLRSRIVSGQGVRVLAVSGGSGLVAQGVVLEHRTAPAAPARQ